jgi:glycosyltransferase involved in cell wall biosynthesis
MNSKQKIHLYSICWNEELLLPYFFKHYDSLVDQYVFYDDGSTDNTLEILHKNPKVEVRPPLFRHVDSYVLAAQEVHNSVWKESIGKVDWVIMTPVDEFLYHPGLPKYLRRCTEDGITVIPALGFQMISEVLPNSNRQIYEELTRGRPYAMMNKLSIFDPNKITETHYHPGRHIASPYGIVVFPERDELMNLHYKYVGFSRTLKRNQDLNAKLGTVDKNNSWGHEYNRSEEEFKKEWNKLIKHSRLNIPSLTNIHDLTYPPQNHWWRS